MKLWLRGIGIEHRDASATHSDFFINLIATLRKDTSQITNLNDP